MEKHSTSRQATDDHVIRRMRTACWIPKATDTHSEYVMLIAFPLQQWSHERPLMLRYMYTVFISYVLPPTASFFMKFTDVQQQYVEVSHTEFHQNRAREVEGKNRSKEWLSVRRFT